MLLCISVGVSFGIQYPRHPLGEIKVASVLYLNADVPFHKRTFLVSGADGAHILLPANCCSPKLKRRR